MQIQLEQERLKKLASKSHRDRIRDFNDQLAQLSVRGEVFYIRVECGGGGKMTCI